MEESIFIKGMKGKTIKYKDSRTGKTKISRDRKRNALLPGKRVSKSGNIYYEKRKNRSDLKGKNI